MSTKKTRQKTTSSSDEIRIIKKYPNRRLYDSFKRSYITLNDIKQYVLDHIAFRVIDAQTEADLTKATLFQVISEHENSANNIFTTELLQQMIRVYHENMQNVFSPMFEQFLTQFIQQKDLWTQRFEKFQPKEGPGAVPPFMDPFKSLNELSQMQRDFWESWLKKNPGAKDKK